MISVDLNENVCCCADKELVCCVVAGMDERHECAEVFSIREYARTQRMQHQEILLEQHRQGKIVLPPEKIAMTQNGDSDMSASGDGDDESDLDIAVDDYYFLQPVPTRQRRMMLRQAGIKKIDNVEKDECKDIRVSREVCGCDCRVYCDPATCLCSLAGIKCQVDRMSFPCGCTKEGCGNTSGRVEFNPMRVRTHFLHTLMRLEFDEKKEKASPAGVVERPAKHIRFNDDDGATGDDAKADLSQFNSTELGSCRDCQNTDVTKVMMRETQLNAAACMMAPQSSAAYSTMLGNAPAGSVLNQSCLQPSMLCGDGMSVEGAGDDDGAAGYQYGPDDDAGDESSYSESSDGSSDGESTNNESACPDYHNLTPTTCFNQQQSFDLAPRSDYETEAPSDYKELRPPMTPTSSAAGSSGYKLGPISEILNPLRYGAYEGGEAWGNDAYFSLSGNTALTEFEDCEVRSSNAGVESKCSVDDQFDMPQTSGMADEYAQSNFESEICSSTQDDDGVTSPCYHELTLSTHQLSSYMSSASPCLTAAECTVSSTATVSPSVENSHELLDHETLDVRGECLMKEDVPTSSSQELVCPGPTAEPDVLLPDIRSGDLEIRSDTKTDIANSASQHDMSVDDTCCTKPNAVSQNDASVSDTCSTTPNAVSPNDMSSSDTRVDLNAESDGMNTTFQVENAVSQNDTSVSDTCCATPNALPPNDMSSSDTRVDLSTGSGGMNTTFEVENAVSQIDVSVSDTSCTALNAVSSNDMSSVATKVDSITVAMSQNDALVSDTSKSMSVESTNGLTVADPNNLALMCEAASTNVLSDSDICCIIPNAVSPNDMSSSDTKVDLNTESDSKNITFKVESSITVEMSQKEASVSDMSVSTNAESTNEMIEAGPGNLAMMCEAASTNDVSDSGVSVGITTLNEDDDGAVSSSVGVMGKDIENESLSSNSCSLTSSDDQGVDASQTNEQNFGHMITESMVETVSA